MTNKKYLIVSVLATFCLTATLFMFVPTRSQSSNYDPWTDVNGDGTIDMADISMAIDGFMTSGDTTKNVNVTNARAKLVEKDLNMSVADARWLNSTDVFETEGYDRMFVSAAIIDTNVNDFIEVRLERAVWYLGIVNGTLIRTYALVDPNKQLMIHYYGSGQLPVASENSSSSEFAIEAAKCSLSFSAWKSWPGVGWVSIHIWIYLSSGTTSPSPIQETYVTNWPTATRATRLIKVVDDLVIDPYGYYFSEAVPVDGYSKVTILIRNQQPLPYIQFEGWENAWGDSYLFETIADYSGYEFVKTYDVMCPYIHFYIGNGPNYASITISFYLVA